MENKELTSKRKRFNESEHLQEELPTDVNKVLQTIEPEKRKVIMGAMYAIEERFSFSGPLPAPEDLKAYKDVMIDAPERIMAMAEIQVEHRIKMEKCIVESGIKQSKQGQLIGGLLALLFLLASVFLGLNGHDWLAGSIVFIIASVATIYVLKREPKNKHSEIGEMNSIEE